MPQWLIKKKSSIKVNLWIFFFFNNDLICAAAFTVNLSRLMWKIKVTYWWWTVIYTNKTVKFPQLHIGITEKQPSIFPSPGSHFGRCFILIEGPPPIMTLSRISSTKWISSFFLFFEWHKKPSGFVLTTHYFFSFFFLLGKMANFQQGQRQKIISSKVGSIRAKTSLLLEWQ